MSSTQRDSPDSSQSLRLAIVGAGYVGLVSGACLSELGHHVTCVDVNTAHIAQLQRGDPPIYEPGLTELVRRGAESGRLRFTSDISRAVSGADAAFIAVGTPAASNSNDGNNNGLPDLTAVHAAARQIAQHLTGPCVVVIKSTVPAGTADSTQQALDALRPTWPVEVASNPEFLRQGSAVSDFMQPDRIVIGARSERGRAVLAAVYAPLVHRRRDVPVLYMGTRSAELAKCAANAFLATKAALANEVAEVCERAGADVADVARAVGLDARIGPAFLSAGPGFGGSCLRKDALALAHTARGLGCPATVVEAAVSANDARRVAMARKVVEACGGSVRGVRVAVLGVAFKAGTDDVRDAPALVVLPYLLKRGACVTAYDPRARRQAEKALPPGVVFVDDVYAAVEGADVVLLMTDWEEFRALDMELVRGLVRRPVFVDLRNVYEPEVMCELGFRYVSVGRAAVGWDEGSSSGDS